jgi:hypothetical protein
MQPEQRLLRRGQPVGPATLPERAQVLVMSGEQRQRNVKSLLMEPLGHKVQLERRSREAMDEQHAARLSVGTDQKLRL